jgi:hypothetical protein
MKKIKIQKKVEAKKEAGNKAEVPDLLKIQIDLYFDNTGGFKHMDNEKTRDLPLPIILEDEDKLVIDGVFPSTVFSGSKRFEFLFWGRAFSLGIFFMGLISFFILKYPILVAGKIILLSVVVFIISELFFRLASLSMITVTFNRRTNEVSIEKIVFRGTLRENEELEEKERVEIIYKFDEGLLQIEEYASYIRYSSRVCHYYLQIPYYEEKQTKDQPMPPTSSSKRKNIIISKVLEKEEFDKLIEARNYIVDFMTFGAGSRHEKESFPIGEVLEFKRVKEGGSFVEVTMLIISVSGLVGTFLWWTIAKNINKAFSNQEFIFIFPDQIVVIYAVVVVSFLLGFYLLLFNKRFRTTAFKAWQKQRETKQKVMKAIMVILPFVILILGILSFVIYFLFFDFSALYSLLERF